MTLRDFFQLCADNPFIIISFFLLVPFTALLAGILGKGEGHISPWKYLYSTLLYLVCIPGIFAISLNIYLFLFERGNSVMDMNLYTQILPILSMVATILLVRKNVSLDYVPGFDKIGGLFMMIAAALLIMWVFDRTHIWMVTRMPFGYAICIFAGLLLAIRFGWSRMLGGSKQVSTEVENQQDWYKTK
jgi:hypothetical protein